MTSPLGPAPDTIRPARSGDVAAVVALDQECFDDPWSQALVEAELAGPGAVVDVAVDVDATLLGWTSVSVVGDVADLRRIAVAPRARTRGIGSRLLERALGAAGTAGAVRLLLEVADDNVAARALYARFDFEQIHVRRGYYAGGADALVLERGLP